MTRTEKQHKLGNAIREYRGLYHAQSRAWIHAPKARALPRVERWLGELDLEVSESVKEINAFASLNEFNDWMRGIDTPTVIRP